MNTPNTKEEIILQLYQQFPSLTIDAKLSGYITEIDQATVYARIYTEDDEQYDCELDKSIFPQEDLAKNRCFFMVLGHINQKPFTHINYFYWTQEQLDLSKKEAEQLYRLLNESETKQP